MTTLKLEFGLEKIERIEDKSFYNHNYYKVVGYGDWCSFQNASIIEEVCHEDENYYSFALGNFDENGDFQTVICWNSDYGCSGIKDYISGN